MTRKHGRDFATKITGTFTIGVVLLMLGIWMLTGDIDFGWVVITRSVFFGVVSTLAGVAFIVGGFMSAARLRSR